MNYFIAPEAVLADIEADDAASMADDAADMADDAAVEADIALDDESIAGDGVTTVVVDVVAGVVAVASSFLLQAAKETAATRETIRNAFFILVLYLIVH